MPLCATGARLQRQQQRQQGILLREAGGLKLPWWGIGIGQPHHHVLQPAAGHASPCWCLTPWQRQQAAPCSADKRCQPLRARSPAEAPRAVPQLRSKLGVPAVLQGRAGPRQLVLHLARPLAWWDVGKLGALRCGTHRLVAAAARC